MTSISTAALHARQPLETPPGAAAQRLSAGHAEEEGLRQTFDEVVGELLFGQMLKSMRKTVGKPAYFHGGKAEEIFTGQLDQVLSQKLTAASAHQVTGPMFELFTLSRR